jgi:DNA mismatch repair protein MutS
MTQPSETPVMRQYSLIKAEYPDAILFFQMGDFYEMFMEDAVVASQALELTLTSRDKKKENAIPMCGIPLHSVSGYLRKLLDQGFKVAICDQVEDPRMARGIVKRAVTQVVTPGVVLDTEHLTAKDNNYLTVICAEGRGKRKSQKANDKRRMGVAALDLSTCELRLSECEGDQAVADELSRLAPKEVLYAPEVAELARTLGQGSELSFQPGAESIFADAAADKSLVTSHCDDEILRDSIAELPQGLRAAAAALRYAAAAQPGHELPRCRVLPYEASQYLQLDETSLRNLEVFYSLMERSRKGSLLATLDRTQTAMGGRALRQMLATPLLSVADIRRRQDAVEALFETPALREELRTDLRSIYDLERLTTRTLMEAVTPRELARLGRSLAALPKLAGLLAKASASSLSGALPDLLRWPADDLSDVAQTILDALVEDPPPTTRDGGVFSRGHDSDLDEVIDLCEGGKSAILGVETRERERTGINTLKIRYNKVFGYFIEITKSKLKDVPEEYQRKQTLVNAERFITEELSQYEDKVLGAQERRSAMEANLFAELRAKVAEHAERLRNVAQRVAQLDVFCCLAEVAQANDHVRPVVDDSKVLSLVDARHPVVEAALAAGQFVPNDVELSQDENRMIVLTGPNMSGKSTVMRQVCLISLMAQMGAFVPCRRARIGLVDRIFTRVGASDNLARGESTFMVEMRETAAILRHATSRSLVVLDEIGRGTATYDGISIAWSVAEALHDKIQARCMFATHYHELCLLAEVKPHVVNFNVAIQEWKGKVIFLHKLAAGGSDRSYGIEVAKLAGLDPTVVRRARRVLLAMEEGAEVEGVPLGGRRIDAMPQLSLFQKAKATPAERELTPVEATLSELDLESMTPLEALNALAELVTMVAEPSTKN